ncbi:pyridoxal phosphate-dependent aminotransferase [Saccharomonospora glauca]|uniref:Aminotransferase n=1 Tax=Saccharomonospora glauca K62 TaxID=928724 RepID=I1D221_9PSEU|nr:pyridoxal phosphate-dependent aminotransferase [Saccharomonospora glauca]EIE98995.1 aspartate/tyrosine/aromatic aminotransferase [Saccharomonospora glauca K62]
MTEDDRSGAGAAREPYSKRARDVPSGGLVTLLGSDQARTAVDLATGTPAAPKPADQLVDAACSMLRAGVHQYEAPAGNAELRSRIAGSFTTPADPDTEITVTVGGTEALFVALLSIIDPGDEVVIFDPYYDNFLGSLALAGAIPRFVPLRAPEWRFDPAELAAAFTPRTKAVLLNTPHNPTGRVLDREELDHLAALCEKWGALVISDEVYSAYTYDDHTHVSLADVPALAQRSIVVGSLSKSHALSGWRMGFLRAAPEHTRVLRQVHIAVTGGTAAPLQRAVVNSGVLEPGAWRPADELQKARDRVIEIFSGIGLKCCRPQGGCYVMADVRPVTNGDCHDFATALLDHAGVLVVPSTVLFAEPADGNAYVRIAFNKSETLIEEAARRIERARRTWPLATV